MTLRLYMHVHRAGRRRLTPRDSNNVEQHHCHQIDSRITMDVMQQTQAAASQSRPYLIYIILY